MNNVIILGDPHLGKSVSLGKNGSHSSINSRIEDQLNLLNWVLDQAVENYSNDIIITGDVFDEPKPHHSLITLFMSWLNKCKINNVNVHIILGNHDILRTGKELNSPLDIIEESELTNVSIYKNIDTIFIGTSAFTLVPFHDRKYLNCSSNSSAISMLTDILVYELSLIPITYHKILIGHLAIEGSIPIGDEIDDLNNELLCPVQMFNGYDYIWMGHVHKPQMLHKKPYIYHIGSMDISNFGEANQRKHIIIFNCDTGKFSAKYLPTRPLKKICISVPQNIKNATDFVLTKINKLEEDLNNSIVRVEISLEDKDSKSINKSSILKVLESKGVFNVSGISESKKVSIIKKENNNLNTKMDVPSAIKVYVNSYVKEPLKPKVIELAMEIYNTYKSEVKD